MSKVKTPVQSFKTKGGRTFTVGDGTHDERYKGDPLWSDCFPILLDGKPAGKLFWNENYGKTVDGKPRWQASTRELYWSKAADAPTGVGFDVSAFDTAEECLKAWGRSADEILDWSEGKQVLNIYSKTGYVQKGT